MSSTHSRINLAMGKEQACLILCIKDNILNFVTLLINIIFVQGCPDRI